eukprot:4630782-Pyramimonas_sp.AAC.1
MAADSEDEIALPEESSDMPEPLPPTVPEIVLSSTMGFSVMQWCVMTEQWLYRSMMRGDLWNTDGVQ